MSLFDWTVVTLLTLVGGKFCFTIFTEGALVFCHVALTAEYFGTLFTLHHVIIEKVSSKM